MRYLIVLAAVFLGFLIVFFISERKNKYDLLDLYWGLSFAVAAWSSYLISDKRSALAFLLSIMASLWGLRLFIFLSIRNLSKGEDKRYTEMKQKAGLNSAFSRFVRFFLPQFVLSVIISSPIVIVNLSRPAALSLAIIPGLIIWAIGLFFETVADWQKYRFKNQPGNAKKLMTSGLWQFSRHPNYFGESMVWWGVFLVIILRQPGLFWLVYSPALITYLLLNVSGVPLLEKEYKNREGWALYQASTSKFFPLPPKNKKAVKS
ncbi:MAG: DUF1295 domain-containing protein [Anaerolineaceae bacterium]|nr:DUF1295 domain-containing protein [Anaerolineaceae bacterium]